jgi:phosphate transport system substrate-binding protein
MRFSTFVFLAAAIVALSGCGGGGAAAPGGSSQGNTGGGTIVIDGSSTVYRISRAAQIGFAKDQGGSTRVLVGNRGTSGGFGRYLEGEVDIVDASRPARPEEEEQAKAKGLDWTRFVVGYDGITLVVNPANTFVKSLSVEQLKHLFAEGSTVTKWSELDPSWPDRKIVLYTPDNDSGTYQYFSEAILGSDKARQRKDVQPSPDDNVLVTGVAGDADALGYFGYAYYAANKDRLRPVPVQDGPDAPPVMPTPETILDLSYKPLSRPLFLYVKNQAMRRPEVAAFLRYYINNLDSITTRAGYVPPHAEDQQRNLKALPAG